MGMMNEIPFCSKGPKGGGAQVLQDAEINAAYFGKVQGLVLHVHWSRFRRNSKNSSTQTTHKESVMSWQEQVRKCILHKSIQS